MVTGTTLGYGDKRLKLFDVVDALRSTGIASLDLLMITAAAGFIIGVLNITGLSFALTLLLVQVGSGNLWLLLVLAALVSIILGMGMPTVGVYVLLAALVAPAMVKIGLSPMASHMFVMYFGMMSMITPPVALAAYAAASLAQYRSDEDRLDRGALRLDRLHHPVPVHPRALAAAGRIDRRRC